MRRLLLFFVLLMPFAALSNYAQEKLEHLTFMGIPIDGKFNKFKKSLEKKGLKYIMPLNNHYIFKGSFAGDESYIYVMCDNKAKTVYGVGVSINCLSQEIAKNKFDNYVRDYKDKYETDKWYEIHKYYSENRDSLSEHIVNGTFQYYNESFTDSISNKFEILVSKIVLDEKEKTIVDPSLKYFLGLKYITCMGNIGTIKVIYDNEKNKISITYRDEQNASMIEDKRKEDL